MKERPILFSSEMVQAILAGRKTQTRRTRGLEEINKNPDDWQFEWADFALTKPYRFTQKSTITKKALKNQSFCQAEAKCPYGKRGDILWVRETFTILEPEHCMGGMPSRFVYKADCDNTSEDARKDYIKVGYPYQWKPSIHMPKEAARIWLKIVKVKAERLQSLAKSDSINEGIMPLSMSAMQMAQRGQLYYDYSKPKQFFNDGLPPLWSFNSLWCSIHGPDSWDLNPWVWVIEFERLEKRA